MPREAADIYAIAQSHGVSYIEPFSQKSMINQIDASYLDILARYASMDDGSHAFIGDQGDIRMRGVCAVLSHQFLEFGGNFLAFLKQTQSRPFLLSVIHSAYQQVHVHESLIEACQGDTDLNRTLFKANIVSKALRGRLEKIDAASASSIYQFSSKLEGTPPFATCLSINGDSFHHMTALVINEGACFFEPNYGFFVFDLNEGGILKLISFLEILYFTIKNRMFSLLSYDCSKIEGLSSYQQYLD